MKSQLIEKQGKYYKEVKVVMLPALKQEYQVEEGAIFINDSRQYNWGSLQALKCERVTVNGHAWNGSGIQTYINHLYFLSDEEVKDGDWYYSPNGIISKMYKGEKLPNDFKKIIATTDISLPVEYYSGEGDIWNKKRYPEPSPEFIQAFIEAYNSGKPITKVLVEYEQYTETSYSGGIDISIPCVEPKLKDNQIIIKKIEERMYSESEVIAFSCWHSGMKKERIIKALKRYHEEMSQ